MEVEKVSKLTEIPTHLPGDDECTGEVTICSWSGGVEVVSGMEGFSGLLEHPSPFSGCSKNLVRMGWDYREDVFNGFLPVLNPNGFMTGWWWVVTTWRKIPGKPEREVSSAVGAWAICNCESSMLLSHWVMRHDRLGNAGIKLTYGLWIVPKAKNRACLWCFGVFVFLLC